jgi:hypothetical protein
MEDVKIYKVEFILEGSKLTMNSHNDGFDVLQLIGLLERKKDDLLTQIRDSANFDRKCVTADGELDITKKEVVDE